MPNVPFQAIPPIDEKTAIAQVNATLREILNQLEQINQHLATMLRTRTK
jgi:hypothetical protein